MSISTVSKCALAALFCSFACFAEDPELPEADVTQLTEEPELDEAEPEADEFRATWECAGGELNREFVSDPFFGVVGIEEHADPFYCLTKCDGHYQISRAKSDKVKDPSRRTDSWCLAHAAYYCARIKRELDGWCWGMRGYDDDEDE